MQCFIFFIVCTPKASKHSQCITMYFCIYCKSVLQSQHSTCISHVFLISCSSNKMFQDFWNISVHQYLNVLLLSAAGFAWKKLTLIWVISAATHKFYNTDLFFGHSCCLVSASQSLFAIDGISLWCHGVKCWWTAGSEAVLQEALSLISGSKKKNK